MVNEVCTAVRRGLEGAPRIVLAVSGGRDSTVLLDAAAAVLPRDRLVVATFDHGTGEAARNAAAAVESGAARLGLPVRTGRASLAGATEATWRDARWSFLRAVAADERATVATAHTRDDNLETIVLRVVRGAGARGLAALFAPGDVLRPLVETSRESIATYASVRRLTWVDDPSNDSAAYLRNRVRRDLLPALTRARPELADDLLELGRRAAEWRGAVERVVDDAVAPAVHGRRGLDVAALSLAGYSPRSLAVLWPAIAGRVGLALDHRGTRRLVEFTSLGRVGTRVQVAGGWEVYRTTDRFELRRAEAAPEGARTLRGPLEWGEWRFTPVDRPAEDDPWTASFPATTPLTVRGWRPGDSMELAPGRHRKIKHLLSDRRIAGHRRASWPVVLAGERIAWIPGVRRSDAATDRSGRPGRTYRCELHDR